MEYLLRRLVNSNSVSWIYIILITTALLAAVSGMCTFPSNLTGQWVRGHDDRVLTFTSNQVTGIARSYFAVALDIFDCDFRSGNTYILSTPYTSLAPEDRMLYLCWHLEEVTSSAFILYDLTDSVAEVGFVIGEPGFTALAGITVSQSTVCTKTVSSTLFTTLIKDGATASDVASTCPSSLFATFTYGLCADTQLSFCPDRQTANVDYLKCSTQILNSANGVLSCMGHVDQSPYTYVNLYNHDSGSGVTCLRVLSANGLAYMADYYPGDCTTASGSGTNLALTSTATCPIDDDDDDDDDDDNDNEESGGSATATVTGAIAGGAIATVLVVFIVAAIVYHFVTKKGNSSRIDHVNTGDKMAEAERGHAEANGIPGAYTGPATISSNFPFPEPHDSPRRLPPIETRDTVPGEPLRK